MIPAAFDYVRVDSAEAAIAALTEYGDEAKLLAGGHSLLPLMKLRLAMPTVLVDVARLDAFASVTDPGTEADHISVGALTRICDLERDANGILAAQAPILREGAQQVGDPQVRHRATIGGSIAHGDPASDLPAVLLALRATLVAQGPTGTREIPVDDFFCGFLETALQPDELLIEIRVPKVPDAGWSFQKFNRRAIDWAIVGVAVVAGDRPGIGLVNMASTPVRSTAAEAAVAGGAGPEEAGAVASEGLDPPEDINASVDFRRHLAGVLVRRGLTEAADRATS